MAAATGRLNHRRRGSRRSSQQSGSGAEERSSLLNSPVLDDSFGSPVINLLDDEGVVVGNVHTAAAAADAPGDENVLNADDEELLGGGVTRLQVGNEPGSLSSTRSRGESPATPELEITPYPGPESEDELGPSCPTCKGRGEVERDDEEDTIALIPVKDKRLQPRKTKLYIVIAVLTSIAICTALTYFLFERSVSVDIASAYVINYNVSAPNAVAMTAVIKILVTNQNYFKVTMKNLSISISGPENVGVCYYDKRTDNSLTASALSTNKFLCTTVITFRNDHASQIREACEMSWAWNHFILIMNMKVSWEYLIFDSNHVENIDWDCFTCRRGNFPDHDVKHSCYSRNHTAPHRTVPIEPLVPVTVDDRQLTVHA